jgi:hypothetical protein
LPRYLDLRLDPCKNCPSAARQNPGGNMDKDDLQRRAAAANRAKQVARKTAWTSQEGGRRYLAAIEHQIAELKEIRRIGGEDALNANISGGIESLERDAAEMRAEIPTLRIFPDI